MDRKMDRKINARNWIIGMILCPLGVCFSAKSGFGVSMVEAPVFVLYNKISELAEWYTFGTSEYLVQGLLMLALFIVMRKFIPRYLLSFGTAVIYGFILDGWYMLVGRDIYIAMPARIISAAVGMSLTSFAVAMFFRTSWPQEVWELFVKEISENFGLDMTAFKLKYDIASLATGIILMLIFFRRFDLNMIGIGTLIMTFVNAPMIGFWGKLIDRYMMKNH